MNKKLPDEQENKDKRAEEENKGSWLNSAEYKPIHYNLFIMDNLNADILKFEMKKFIRDKKDEIFPDYSFDKEDFEFFNPKTGQPNTIDFVLRKDNTIKLVQVVAFKGRISPGKGKNKRTSNREKRIKARELLETAKSVFPNGDQDSEIKLAIFGNTFTIEPGIENLFFSDESLRKFEEILRRDHPLD